MRKFFMMAAVVALSLAVGTSAMAGASFTKEAVQIDGSGTPGGLSQDCLLQSYNTCACWVWVFSEAEGGIWGTVLDPNDCPGGCASGGAVSDIWFWGSCNPGPPATLGSVGLATVDAAACLTGSLYESGPISVTTCVSGDRWTQVSVPLVHVNGNEFAVTVTWGPDTPALMRFATDNGIGNLFCYLGVVGTFPGCASTTCTCVGWTLPSIATYLYLTDFNGDTILDDLCALYGVPYGLAFPYIYPYGYLANNLMVYAGLDCSEPTATENTSWGHVKALYE